MPFDHRDFFSIVKDVDSYKLFVPYMTNSRVVQESHTKTKDHGSLKGSFDAITDIGFTSVNFSYVSRVTYHEPSSVLSISGQ